MVDTTSSSSDDEPVAQRSQLRSRLSTDRGVVHREAWAAASDSDGESANSSDTEDDAPGDDDSDHIPLAQRDEAEDSGEETEEEGINLKQRMRSFVDGDAIHIKTEVEEEIDEADSSSDVGSDDEVGDKSKQDEETDTEEIKPEEEGDGANAMGDEDAAPGPIHAELVDLVGSEGGVVERRTVRPPENGIAVDTAIQSDGERDGEKEKEAGDRRYGGRGEDEEAETEEELDESETPVKRDVEAARLVEHYYQKHLSFTEQAELYRGKHISGPPIDRPLSQIDQWKRKYRWPVAMRNVRRRRFIADADEITTDHEVQLVDEPRSTSHVSATARKAFAAALAPTARPLMRTAVATLREQNEKRQQEMRFVERLEETNESESNAVDATRLRALSRLGGHFTDQVLDSLLVTNALALQGVDASYAQQCWDPLPTSKRPVANWRFVLEHFCRTSTHGVDAMPRGSAPRLRKDTLIRIRDRLRVVYGVAWRPEDAAFFDLVDQQIPDPPEPTGVYRL